MSNITPSTPFPFGKYKGTPIREVPKEYVQWFLQQDWAGKFADLKAYFKSLEPKDPTSGWNETPAANWSVGTPEPVLNTRGVPEEFEREECIKRREANKVINGKNVVQFMQMPLPLLKQMAGL